MKRKRQAVPQPVMAPPVTIFQSAILEVEQADLTADAKVVLVITDPQGVKHYPMRPDYAQTLAGKLSTAAVILATPPTPEAHDGPQDSR